MAIPKVLPRTAILKGKDTGVMKELPAAAAITPGHLVEITSASKWQKHATAKGDALRAFAVEADLIGKGLDDAYAANDVCYVWILERGAEVNALVAPSASPIVVGNFLESDGAGGLRIITAQSQSGTTPFAVTAGGVAIAQAIQAVDNSGNASTSARIQVLVL